VTKELGALKIEPTATLHKKQNFRQAGILPGLGLSLERFRKTTTGRQTTETQSQENPERRNNTRSQGKRMKGGTWAKRVKHLGGGSKITLESKVPTRGRGLVAWPISKNGDQVGIRD